MEIVCYPSDDFTTQANIVRRVADHLGDGYKPSHVVLDRNDYSHDRTFLDEFRDIAFSWTPDRPIDNTPPHIRQLMARKECITLIWLSRMAMDYDEVLFTWVVAHELRHIYQSRYGFPSKKIRSVALEFRRKAPFMSLPSSILAPDEIDSEICGLSVAKKLCGAENVARFLSFNKLPRCPHPAYPKFLECVQLQCFN